MPPVRTERRSLLVFAGLVFGHLLLISAQVPLGREQTLFKTALTAAVLPVQKAGLAAGRVAGSAFREYRELRAVRREAQRLRKEDFFLRQENAYLRDALAAAAGEASLRAGLERFAGSVRAARVIAFDASTFTKSLTVNAGSADGVRKDMAVVDRAGNLVGRTVEPVTAHAARVQLVTDDEGGVSVVSVEDRVIGFLSGTPQTGLCQLKYVMTTTRGGKEGELLVTTGYDRIYPAGLPVGTIESIRAEGALFKTIVVRPRFDFRDLDTLAVLTKDYSEWPR